MRLPHLRALMDAARQEAKAARREASASGASPAAPAGASAAAPAPGRVSDAELVSAAAALRAVLARNELDDAVLGVVCAGLESRGDRDQALALRAAIDAFEFDRAGALLDAALAEPAAGQTD
jgi:hypothetical protein